MLSKLSTTRRSFTSQSGLQPQVTKLLINGKFVNSISGKTFDTINPATEQKIVSIQEAGQADVDEAVKAARKAFDEGPWRRMPAVERGNLMHKLVDLIEKNIDELSALESLDTGKPIWDAKHVDIGMVIKCLRYYAGWPDKITGRTIPISSPHMLYTREEPVGVCGQIIPWNFPAAMMSWKLGPALATGCTIVLKPAEQTPLTALRIGELIMEAGFPEGVVNILPGLGASAGRALVQHALVDKIAFTGSTAVGYEIMRTAHQSNIKRITLELGGKSANIIMDDADIDLALAQSQNALYYNMGQCCVAGSRLFVHEKIYDEFVHKSVDLAKKRKLGDPFAADTEQGPQIDKKQQDKVLGYIDSGKKEGAKLLTGGNKWGQKGYYVEPTVFADVKDDMTIAKEEIFGPVMSILKFKNIDEVIQRANNSNFGLAAGVVTKSIDNALKLSNALRAGTVWVNCYNQADATTPFGGFKDSGLGRELGEAGLKNYLETKTVVIKRPDDSLP